MEASATAPPAPPSGVPLDESYRAEFGKCDRANVFEGVQLPIPRTRPYRWYGCEDRSNLSRLERIAAKDGRPEAVVFTSKIAWDRDGSAFACSTPGRTDQCGTSLTMAPTASHPCPRPLGTKPPCVPVAADRVPYVVLPAAAPTGIDRRKFAALTGLRFGDFGVVIANGRVVPVVIADGGPAYKVGEGSGALLERLSTDGKVHSIGSGVTFVLFPGTRETLSPDTIEAVVARRGLELWARLQAGALAR